MCNHRLIMGYTRFNMIKSLKSVDGLREGDYNNIPLYIHNDHRYVLPLLYNSQKSGLIPKPCKMVVYDYHDDLVQISDSALESIKKLLTLPEFDEDRFFEIVKDELDQRDCDWIKAGMELEIIGDVVIFGVHEPSQEYKNHYEDFIEYNDHRGTRHTVFVQAGTPEGMFGMQGPLGDTIMRCQSPNVRILDMLDWSLDNNPAGFIANREKIVLNFDLDAFTMHHDKYVIPWIEDIWDDQMLKTSDYHTTVGMSAALFTKQLADKSGVVIITQEPDWCTGPAHKERGVENANQILTDLNEKVFNNEIRY